MRQISVDPVPHAAREWPREDVANSLPRAVILVPLGRLGGDPLLGATLSLVEHHLGDGQDREVIAIADQAHVELATLHELLRDGGLAEAIMHPADPLAKRGRILHDRRLGDTLGRVGLQAASR